MYLCSHLSFYMKQIHLQLSSNVSRINKNHWVKVKLSHSLLSLVRFFSLCDAAVAVRVWHRGPFCQTFNKSSNTGWGQQSECEGKSGDTRADQALCLAAWRIFVPPPCKQQKKFYLFDPLAEWIMKCDSLSGLLQLHWTDKLSRKSRNFHSLFLAAQSWPEAGCGGRGPPHQSLCCPGSVPIIMEPAIRISAVILHRPP